MRAPSSEPVNGRWLLTGVAGRGASGLVYRAFDLVAEEVVALKAATVRPRPRARGGPARREFLELAQLRHPNLVETYDLGRAESGPLPRGTPFFTMELLERPPHPWRADDARRLARLALGLLAGLDCVHSHGLVHRDVKPANVLLDARRSGPDRVKLSDLDLASSAERGEGGLSGTLQYAAPEAIAGGAVGPRSDLYSLGVLLFEVATGTLPFDGSDPAAALAWHLGSRGPGSLDSRGLPPRLSRVVGRLLAPSPEARYATAREAWEEIAEVVPEECEAPSLSPAIADGPLVGRGRERAALVRWLRAKVGEGGRLKLRGPGGSGLSRLAREAALFGRAERWSVHVATCAAGAPPFHPFHRSVREILLTRSAAGRLSARHGAVPGESEFLSLLGGPALWGVRGQARAEAAPSLAAALAGFLAANGPGRPLLLVLDEFDRADATVAAVVRELDARAAEGRGTGPMLVTAERTDEDENEGAARSDRGSWRRGRRRRGAGGEPVGAASVDADELRLDPLEPETCAALLATVPGVGVLGPAEVAAVIRAAEGWPGRLVRIARSVAGPQRPLFPPLSEPREQAARSLEARPR